MKLMLKTKIVIYEKYFYTMESLEIDENNIDTIIGICDTQRYRFLTKIMNQDFIPLNIEEAGIRSISKKAIDEVRVEIYHNEKRISLQELENLLNNK